jgi:allophanate hydrolase
VTDVLAAGDVHDPWSRSEPPSTAPRTGRLAVPLDGQALPDDGPPREAWLAALEHAAEHWDLVPVDVTPLLEAAPLLYDVWMAERTADLGAAVSGRPDGLDPVVGRLIDAGAGVPGPEVFAAQHRVAALRRAAAPIFAGVDALLMPTVPGHPTHEQVAADPVSVNAALGRFTNFVNLMDLAAVAVPGPARSDGLPSGVTLLGPAFSDRRLLELGAAWRDEPATIPAPGMVPLAVVGAHLRGQPLNGQLTERGARLVATTATSAEYRLYALASADGVARPGLVRVAAGGASIEAEVWELAPAALGELLTLVPAPLGIGRVTLADGRQVAGFICEAVATAEAHDITQLGGWRAYVDRAAPRIG